MAGRRAPSRKTTAFVQTPAVDDAKTQRALDVLASATQDLQSRRQVGMFSSTEDGFVPASGGSATDFLCADGTWKAPSGGGGAVSSVTAGTNLSGGGSSGDVTLNVVANPTFAGLVTASAGITVAGSTTLSAMTAGSVLFAGTSGVVTQDNSNLFWDDSNNRLGVGAAAAPASTLDVRGADANDVVRIKNTGATGYSAVAFWDSGNVLRGATGWGNASVADTTVASKLYWRTLGNDMVFARTSATPSTAMMSLFDSTGNVIIGSSTSDPSVRLKVEGALTVTTNLTVHGNAALGDDATADTHTVLGDTTITGGTAAALTVKTPGQANIILDGDSDNTGSTAGYTGFVIQRAGVEKWYIGRDGTGNTDGLIFRRSATTNDLKIDTSGNVIVSTVLCIGGASGPLVQSGTGSPESVVTAPVGSIFLRTDGGAGTTLYVKESGAGNTGWIGK